MVEQLIPMWRKRHGGGSLPQLIQQTSLYALQQYLHDSPKIAVMHNADDVILGPGDIGFLRRTFGDRLTLYPLGGHCGNLNYRVNAQDMLNFFRGQDATLQAAADTGKR
ncbi:serine/threonine protein kinase, partial [Pseudomonas sp. JH-2]|nr:serine/threonine protein kinase [Pseudomonas sp. JH-2]